MRERKYASANRRRIQRDDFKDPASHIGRICAHIFATVPVHRISISIHIGPPGNHVYRSRHVEVRGSKGQCFSLSSSVEAKSSRVSSSSSPAGRHITATIVYTCVPCYRSAASRPAIKSLVVAKAYIAVICRPSFLATVAAAASVAVQGTARTKVYDFCGARTGRRRYIKATR